MSQRNNSNSVLPKSAGKLLPHDEKEFKRVAKYASEKKNEMVELTIQVNNMGNFKLFWDSKAPDNAPFYHLFSTEFSKREDILEEIKKYQNFYKELGDVVVKANNEIEGENEQNTNIYTTILSLSDKLAEMFQAAKREKVSTKSSKVYQMHQAFIERHKKLESMIKGVECIALKEGYKKANTGWQESTETIRNLRSDWEEARTENAQMRDRIQELMEQDRQRSKQIKDLLKSHENMRNIQENLLEEIQQLGKDGSCLQNSVEKLVAKFEKLGKPNS